MVVLAMSSADARAPSSSGGAKPQEEAHAVGSAPPLPPFEVVYEEHVDMVWRGLRRLGVAESQVEDAAQDVFVTVHRRLCDFQGRSALSTWIFGITLGIARNYRRTARRKPEASEDEVDGLSRPSQPSPESNAEEAQAVRVLYALLDELDDEKREIFVLSELEQASAPEIASALELNVNTVYARIRAARAAFEQAVSRYRARDAWRTK
jgi:RNA polymerase sigma-70 factor (ECF subfamily)